MLLHNLKIAWRNLMKYRLQTCISILSLAVGMVCFSLSALWLHYEKSYDSFWPDAKNTYVVRNNRIGDATTRMPYPYANHFREIPEIETFTRFLQGGRHIKYGDWQNGVICLSIDSTYAAFSGVKVLAGDANLWLRPNEVALTESLADEIFPDGNALGKVLKCEYRSGEEDLFVKAVVADTQEPTSWPYRMLIGIDVPEWDDCNKYAFEYLVRVHPDNLERLSEKLANDSTEVTIHDNLGKAFTFVEGEHLDLIPLTKIREEFPVNIPQAVRLHHLQLFVLLGFILIGCALFNYFTLLVARIRLRQRELLLRYVFGSNRSRLVVLITTEILFIVAASIALGLLCLTGLMDEVKNVSQIAKPTSYFILCYLAYSGMIAVVSVAAAAAIITWKSRQQLSQVLDKRTAPTFSTRSFRINLATQLAVSICAVFCSAVMMLQIHYLVTSPDMGFTKHNVIKLNLGSHMPSDNISTGAHTIFDKMKAMPEITELLFDYEYPIDNWYIYTNHKTLPDGTGIEFKQMNIDEDLLRFADIQLLEGRLPHSLDDPTEAVVTESMAKMLGDSIFSKPSLDYMVTGIVRDINYMTPTAPIPYILFTPKRQLEDHPGPYNILFKYAEGVNYHALTDKIYEMAKAEGIEYFAYTDVESAYEEMLSSENMLVRLLMLVTATCVLISVFGIFSTLSLALQRRRKEIALRKIHGAKVRDIFRLFLSEYAWLLLGAAVVAFPVGFYLMHQWLSQYTRQVPFAWWLCPAILLAMAALILLTVFWQIWRAAKANAAEVIKE